MSRKPSAEVRALVESVDEFISTRRPKIDTSNMQDNLLAEAIDQLEELSVAFRNLAKLNRVIYDVVSSTQETTKSMAADITALKSICASRCER